MKLPGLPPQVLAGALRVGMFAVLAILGMYVFGWLLVPMGYLIASALAVFAAAAVANTVAMRIYEHQPLMQVGFQWNRAAVIHLAVGLAAGMLAALFVTLGPILEGGAELVPSAEGSGGWSSIVFLLVMLLFGGIGEELLFHGYAFQVLMNLMGPFATILPVAVLFAVAHGGNLSVNPIGLMNTGLWGVLFGYAFFRSGDLWLPIGLHVGWNWILPLFGANLSGFTMRVTGYELRYKLDPLWSGGGYGPEGGLLNTAVLVALFVWLVWKAPVRRQTPYLLRERWEEL